MTTCSNCGHANPEGFRFCGMCAQPLAPKISASETRRTVTVLFSDLTGSTAMGERLDPEAIRRIMSRYFREMQGIIERHGGRLEKFIGDAIKADFGAPVSHEDDALRAVRAALEMREAQDRLNDEFEREWGVRLAVRTGLNTGEVVAATSGEHQSLVLGDTVNTAARFEQAAPPGEILIGETTYRLVRDAVEAEPVEPLALKGKTEPVPAWRLISLRQVEPGVPRRPETPLVGREQELAWLEQVLNRVESGRTCQTVLILADPGVGKSRLVSEFGRRVEGTATIQVGRTVPYGEGVTYRPVVDVVRWSVGALEHDAPEDSVKRLHGFLADEPEGDLVAARLARVLGVAAGTATGEETRWAVRRFVERLARDRPLVLVVEDVHWAEDALLDVVEDLALSLRDVPVLLMATARPELLDPRRGWSEGSRAFHVLTLNPLAAEEAGLLVEAAMGESSVAPDLVQAVTSAAEGNPLFVEETIAMLLDTGALRREGERWVTTSPLASLSIPPTLSLLIQSRIDVLPEAEQAVLSRASVIGRLFPLAALESLSDDPATLDTPLHALVDRGFLQPEDPRAAEYGFRHVLVRDTAYERLPKMIRAELHERFADWLEAESRSGDPTEELVGAHLERALRLRRELGSVGEHLVDLASRAGRALAVACRRAMARGAPATADDVLTRLMGVSSVPGLARRADGIGVVAEAGKLAVTLGRWQSAVELLSPHIDLRHPPILRDLGVALCKFYRAEADGSEYRRGQSYLKEAADLAADDADAYASLGGTWKGLDERRAASLYGRALEVDPSDPYALGNLLEYEVRERGDLSVVADRLEAIGSAVDRCRRQAAAGENLPWAFYDMGKFLLMLGKPRESLVAYAKAIHASTADWVLAGASASLHNLASVRERVKGYEWVRRLLIAARAARFRAGEAMDELARLTSGGSAIMAPVAIMAGGSTAAEKQVQRYGAAVHEALSDFRGVIISGGTRHGIGALAGDLGQMLGDAVWTIGYVPASNRDGVTPDDDPTRYREIRLTEGDDFSPLEPLQAWIDVLASGVAPAQVRLLGVGGGAIAALEFRMALALGATVGVIRGSGREAGKILRDPNWVTAPNLVPLEPNADDLRRFLT